MRTTKEVEKFLKGPEKSKIITFLNGVGWITIVLSFFLPFFYISSMDTKDPMIAIILFCTIFFSGIFLGLFWLALAKIIEKLEILERINKNLINFFETYESKELKTDN